MLTKEVKERLYTDTPPKLTPSKLNVSFLENVTTYAKTRQGLNGDIMPIYSPMGLIFTINSMEGGTASIWQIVSKYSNIEELITEISHEFIYKIIARHIWREI